MQRMADLLAKTAWRMETPVAWGAFHVLAFAFGTLFALLLAFLLRRTSMKRARWVLFALGALLLLAEAYKQLFYYFILRNETYDWWIFPFQLCSVPMYLCLLLPFVKPGRALDTLCAFLTGFGAMAGFAAFLQPDGLFHPYITLTLHACLWHILQMFIGFFAGFTGLSGKRLSPLWRSMLLYLLLCLAAYGLNCALWRTANGNINMFYIGPMPTTTIVFCKIREAYGQLAATLAYMASACFGAVLFYFPFYLLHSRTKRASCQRVSKML